MDEAPAGETSYRKVPIARVRTAARVQDEIVPEIPPRSAALPAPDQMLVTFDIDCGEIISGHRFVARGIAGTGVLPNPEGGLPAEGFSLEYELVPGIEAHEGDDLFAFIVPIEYEADVPLPWFVADGGCIAPFGGGASTHGSRGDWPVPAGATELRFKISRPPRGAPEEPAGTLIVNLRTASAEWLPDA